MIKAVLWDLDGVLVDTASFHFQAWRQLLASEGKQIDETEFRRTFGLRNDAILRETLGSLPTERVEELSRRKEELFRAKIAGGVAPMPGVPALLERLRQKGGKTAVVSSAPRQNVEALLRGLRIEAAFDLIIAEDDTSRGKPDPQGYLLAAERLGTMPEDCAVIEDAPAGVAAAKRAGMMCIGLAAGRAPDALAEADLVVASLEEAAVYRFLQV